MRRAILFSVLLLAAAGAAQVSYVMPQTVQISLGTNVACTGAVQTFAVNNLGQTQHYFTLSSASLTSFYGVIQAVDNVGNVINISDVLTVPGTISGSGYYPKIQIAVNCNVGGTFTGAYSGAWGTFDPQRGASQVGQVDKLIFGGVPENANINFGLQTPFASSAGTLYARYSAAGAGGSIALQCNTSISTSIVVFTAALANSTALQVFQIPPTPCITANFQYTNNSTSGTLFAEWVAAAPGTAAPGNQYSHITGTTATTIKPLPGFVHTLSINVGAAGSVSLFDLPTASCTGTPATNQVAIVTATATTLQTFTYDVNFLQGICLKASAAMDLTVSYQ